MAKTKNKAVKETAKEKTPKQVGNYEARFEKIMGRKRAEGESFMTVLREEYEIPEEITGLDAMFDYVEGE